MRRPVFIAMGAFAIAALALVVIAGGPREFTGGRADRSASASQTEHAQPVPSAMGPHPRLRVEERVHRFDTMAIGESRSHTFIIHNEGAAPLKLGQPQSTCKCAVGRLKAGHVPPGEFVEVVLEWRGEEPESAFRQAAVIATNDPATPTLVLEVTGRMVAPLSIAPSLWWHAGDAPVGEATTLKGTLTSVVLEHFEIQGIDSSNKLLTATCEPLPPERLAELGAKCGYAIAAQIAADAPEGKLDSALTIRTDRPEALQIAVRVTAVRHGPLRIIPGPGVEHHAAAQALPLGRFAAAEGKSAVLHVFVHGLSQPAEFSLAHKTPPALEFAVDPVGLQTDAAHQHFRLTIAIPPGAPPTVRIRQNCARLVLKTNHPQQPELKFHIEYDSTAQ
ncbi:MAG: DUF1573 domain-containing protein [Planctomycetes bacterium]|nr:DUF1573 domain-containing protein [Planctomycetota bacterium]